MDVVSTVVVGVLLVFVLALLMTQARRP